MLDPEPNPNPVPVPESDPNPNPVKEPECIPVMVPLMQNVQAIEKDYVKRNHHSEPVLHTHPTKSFLEEF